MQLVAMQNRLLVSCRRFGAGIAADSSLQQERSMVVKAVVYDFPTQKGSFLFFGPSLPKEWGGEEMRSSPAPILQQSNELQKNEQSSAQQILDFLFGRKLDRSQHTAGDSRHPALEMRPQRPTSVYAFSCSWL